MCSHDVFDAGEAYQLFDQEKYQEAFAAFKKIETSLSQQGQSSHFVDYYLGILLDIMKDPFEALFYIIRACDTDPLNYHYAKSKMIIFDSISKIMINNSMEGKPHEEVYKIYELIRSHGFLNSNTQFQYIRHLMRRKMHSEALPLIETELERNPEDKELKVYLNRCQIVLVKN